MQQHFAPHTSERYADDMRRSAFAVRRTGQKSVDHHIVNLTDTVHKSAFALPEPLHVTVKISVKDFSRLGQACNAGHIFRAGTKISLLAAAKCNGVNFYLLAHVQETYTLGAVDFVTADGHQIDVHFLGVNSGFAKSLNRIHMEQSVGIQSLDQSTGLSNGLQSTDFIVGVHDRHQNSLRCHGSVQILQAHSAAFIHWQISHPKSLLFQMLHGLQDSRMLDLGGN